MKRRHGINTSHTKHLTNNQQQLQQPTEQTQSPQIQQSPAENSLSVPQTESATIQVNIKYLVAMLYIDDNKVSY